MRKKKKLEATEERASAIEKSMYMTEGALDLDLSSATGKSHTIGYLT